MWSGGWIGGRKSGEVSGICDPAEVDELGVVFGAGFDCDSGGGERGGGGVEGLFEGPGIPEFRVGREESEEGGGGAGPVAGFGEEGIEELEQGRRRGGSGEGFLHFGLGVTEGGGGGERPGEGVGVAEVAGELDFGAATEGGTEGGAEGAEHGGVGGGELVEDFGFGPEAVRGEIGEGDGEGAAGEVGSGGPLGGDGKDGGTADELEEGVAGRVGGSDFGGEGAGAGGEAAEGIVERRGEGGDVVEGEEPVVAGHREQLAGTVGERGEGCGSGIDEVAEEAGGEGFAGAGRALDDQEGAGTEGAEGGEEPSEAAEPAGARREVEAGTKGVQGRGGAIGVVGRDREFEGGAAGFEEGVFAGGDDPAVGRDFDELAFFVSEIEEDLGG